MDDLPPDPSAAPQRCAEAIVEAVCHEMNNYLSAIEHNATLVRKAADPQTADARRLDNLMEASALAQDFIGRLQRFSRFGTPGGDAIDVAQWAADRWTATARNIPAIAIADFDATLPGALALVDADALGVVLDELVANAVDALRERSGIIRLHVNTCPADKLPAGQVVVPPGPAEAYVAITVADSAAGQPPATDARQLFLPCQSGKLRGGGLGLCAAFGLAKSHCGGIVWGCSEFGGAAVSLLLPVV